jgi:hypothetical protein
VGAVATSWTLLGPIFLFFFDGYIEFYWIKTDNFQGSAAIRAIDDVAFISVFINLNIGITFRARSSWHLLSFLRIGHAICPLPRRGFNDKYVNRNPEYLQEVCIARNDLKITGFAVGQDAARLKQFFHAQVSPRARPESV